MTKQEEIRAELEKIKDAIVDEAIDERRWFGVRNRDYVQEILTCLHSQGVVIKVERELPKLSDYDTRQTTDSSVDFQNGFLVAKGAFIKAGYVAVEPLIST